MAERKPFLLRVDREVLDALQRWANDDLRSLNAQIEFVLRRALRQSGREPGVAGPVQDSPSRSAHSAPNGDERPAHDPDATGS